MLDTLNNKELANLKLVKLSENQTLFKEGDFCKSIGIVKSGSLKISSYTQNGNEIIYNILNSDDVFGNNLIFSDDITYKGDVIALKDSEIYIVDKDSLLKLLKKNDKFLLSYLVKQANTTKQLNFTVKLLSFDNAKDRFMYYLKNNNNEITITSITSLSNNLHLSREATSRVISSLIKEERIIKNKNIIKAVR